MTNRRDFIKRIALGSTLILFPSCGYMSNFSSKTETKSIVPLFGDWFVKLDPEDIGINKEWYKSKFFNVVKLPGSIQAQGYGYEVSAETKWWDGKLRGIWKLDPIYKRYRQTGDTKIYEFLQPEKHYLGAVWYSKDFVVPKDWKNKRVTLLMERVHWESMVYVNGRKVGSQNYLGTAHEYDVTDFLIEGDNTLVIRIDNSRKIDVGDMPHSISEQTQGTWNGIVGEILLANTDKVWIDNIQIYPHIDAKKIEAEITLGNLFENSVSGILEFSVSDSEGTLPLIKKEIKITGNWHDLKLEYLLGDKMKLWSEHHPELYQFSAKFTGTGKEEKLVHTQTVTFGMREIAVKGSRISINGKATHLRGNVDCAIFPIHGYPPTEIEWWRELWLLYKEWGMNLVRFHSWCPPEAAFAAADEVGIYLQPECSEWASNNTDTQFHFLMEESKAILKQYGNHPSFIMMALGNEKNIKREYLEELFIVWKKDKRRLYTGKTGGKPLLDEADYYVGGASSKGTTARYYLGWPPRPEPSFFYQFQPSTIRDYAQAVKDDCRPFISHEIAQRCSYPDVINLPRKFTGSLQPTYLEIARDQLEERGMLNQVAAFVNASGKWQVEMYKEEIEANLRTKGIGGFHLLSLQDFPGQGTAPVGFMDFFYDSKPYISSDIVRKFCNPLVILAKMRNERGSRTRTWKLQSNYIIIRGGHSNLITPFVLSSQKMEGLFIKKNYQWEYIMMKESGLLKTLLWN